MRVIGVTGGIAQGKSAVLQLLEAKGYTVLYVDKIAHQSYLPGTACHANIVATFGQEVVAVDGTINRPALGRIVFADKSKMAQLNAIVWPPTLELIKQQLAQFKAAGCGVVFVEAAVLVEAGWQSVCDEVWVVTSDKESQLLRLMARNRLTTAEAEDRIALQTSDEARLAVATRVIRNDSTLQALQEQVEAILPLLPAPIVEAEVPAAEESKDEQIMLVDENNNEIGAVPRSRMRAERLWHRATYILIENSVGQLYVQKRTLTKDYCPGFFDAVTGGVVGAGEDSEASAYREMSEEMGITDTPLTFLFNFKHEDERSRVWGAGFHCVYDGKIVPQASEVSEVVMMTPADIAARVAEGVPFTPDSLHFLELYARFRKTNAVAPPPTVKTVSVVRTPVGLALGAAVFAGLAFAVLKWRRS